MVSKETKKYQGTHKERNGKIHTHRKKQKIKEKRKKGRMAKKKRKI